MIDIKIDRDSGVPLYAQIRDSIKKAVEKRTLNPGDRLPPVAALSKNLGVTACTIRRAFDDLTKDGLAHCHVGRGTFINDPEDIGVKQETVKEQNPFKDDSLKNMQLNSLTRLLDRKGLIKFTSGGLNHNLTKKGIVDKIVKETIKTCDQSRFQTGIPLGKLALREAVSERYSKRGYNIKPENILITGGSQQAVFMMAHRAFLRKHRILFETPWFSGISNTFKAFNHKIHTVPRDHDGPIPSNYQKFDKNIPSTFYVCPIYNNPMGTDMKPGRKKQVVEWIRGNKGDIISDEVYYELYFDKPSDSFLDEVNNGNVAVAGSLSKSFMFGMRLGWIIGSKSLIDELLPLKRTIDMGVPSLVQETALTLLKSGEFDSNLENLRNHYRNIRNKTLEALEKHMPDGVVWTKPDGGFHIWLELPEGYSSVDTYMTAVEKGVAVLPGPILDPDNGYSNALRISYGSIDEGDIEKGIKKLAQAVSENLVKKPCSSGICTDETDFRY